MTFCDLHILDFVLIVNFLLCSGGCITYQGVGTFTEVEENINSRKYINILYTYLWPVIAGHFPTDEYLFPDDNAPVHAYRETKRWKQENVWCTIKIRLQSQITDVKNRTQLVAKMKEIWTSLPQHYIRSLYATIPKRLSQVIRSKGHATKY
jgi:hypothetical protein